MPLPAGWIETTLGELGNWSSGGTPSRVNPEYFNGDIPWVKTGDLDDREITEVEEKISELAIKNSSAKIFPIGSVLIAMYGATIGKTGLLKIEAATNQACAALLNQGITSELIPFVWKYLISIREELRAIGQGGAQPNISQTLIKEYPIALPPLNEQRRIVAKLEAVLAKVQSAQAHLDKIPGLLKRTRQAILSAAVSGKLTADWLEGTELKSIVETVEPEIVPFELREGWCWSTFKHLGELSRGKSKHRPRNDERLFGGDYPFIQTGDVANSGGKITSHKATYSEFGLAQSRLFPAKTLCITIAANIADTALLTYPACFPDSVVGFVANEEIYDSLFAMYYIITIKDDLESFAPATAQKNINLSILNEVPLPVPPIEEQKEIIRRVEALFERLDRIEAAYQAAKAKVDTITQSTLAKAFRGQLVPQDPNDEPASVLLERIKAEKANAVAQPKAAKPKKAANSKLPKNEPAGIA